MDSLKMLAPSDMRLILLACLCASGASAGSIVSASATASQLPLNSYTQSCTDPFSCSVTASPDHPFIANASSGTGGSLYSANVSASAGASVGLGAAGFASASAHYDFFTTYYPSISGTINAGALFQGNLGSSYQLFFSNINATFTLGSQTAYYQYTPLGPFTNPLTGSFTGGVPFTVGVSLNAYASANFGENAYANGVTNLSNIQFFDQFGAPIAPPATTPEPSSVILFGLGLAWMLHRRASCWLAVPRTP